MITVGNNMHAADVRLYGKCEQNGTPSPTSPVDIVCNNGAIKVNSQGQIYTDGTVETISDNAGNSATAEMLLSVGDYKDVQSIANGVVKRNVGVKVLDGTENIVKQIYASTHYRFALKVDNFKSPPTADERLSIMCNYFSPNFSPIGNFANNYGITTAVDREYIYIYSIDYDNTDSTADDFKQWLADQYAAGTPMLIAYPLAEPKIEKVAPQQITGTTVTQTAGSIQNMPMEVSRKNELVKRFVTDSNGVARAVRKVYIGSNLVFEDKYVDFVDLGLPSGLLWAKGNIVKNGSVYSIGNETDNGCYFMWGDTEGYNSDEGYDFSQDNYNAKGLNNISADLSLSQDAAHVLLGGDMCMPTKEEFLELFDNTDTEWVTINGVNGRKFMKKDNHNVYIFFSAGGLYDGTSSVNNGTYYYYWSSMFNNSSTVSSFMTYSGKYKIYPNASYYRYCGMSIRAVQVRQ